MDVAKICYILTLSLFTLLSPPYLFFILSDGFDGCWQYLQNIVFDGVRVVDAASPELAR